MLPNFVLPHVGSGGCCGQLGGYQNASRIIMRRMCVCVDMIGRMRKDITARTCRTQLFETPLGARMSLVLTLFSWFGLGVGTHAGNTYFVISPKRKTTLIIEAIITCRNDVTLKNA